MLILWLLAMLVVTGCRSRKTVERTHYHKIDSVQIKRDTAFNVAINMDSTLHTWSIRTITTYRDDGTKEMEEVEEQHREQVRKADISTSTNASDEMISISDVNDDKATNEVVDATPIVKATNNVKWIVIGTIIIALMAIASLIYITKWLSPF